MTKTFLFLLVILPFVLFGQKTIKVTEVYKNHGFKEVYYVLKSDKSVRHGNYKQLGYKNAVLIDGYYKNGVKDSIWKEYRWGGKIKKSVGNYSSDTKVGIWEFYDSKEELEQKYDFTKNELIYFKIDKKDKDKEFRVINGSDTTKSQLSRPPLFIGGSVGLSESINTIQYPQEAIENEISGKVFITFTIDSNGKTSNHRITQGIGSGCDEEALRVVKLIPDNWLPGILDGQPVNVEFDFPISFKIQ